MKTEKIIHHKGLEAKIKSYENSLCNRTGIVVALSLIGLFVSMTAAGLSEFLWLRCANFPILFGGILFAYSKYAKKVAASGVHYFDGLKLGMRVTLTAIVPFMVFIIVYLKLDSSFMAYIRQSAELGQYLTPFTSGLCVAIEGIVAGFLISYCILPYFKSNNEVE
jgi:hypothetical protein